MFLGFLTMHFTCHFDNTLTHMLIRTQPCTVHMSAGIKLNLKAIDDVKGEKSNKYKGKMSNVKWQLTMYIITQ